MKIIKYSIAAGLLALSGAISAHAQERTLTIANEAAYPPWNATDASGNIFGFDVDIAQDLCKRLNATCKIVAQDWDGLIPALNAGKFDAIISSLSITEERRKAIDFTRPYAAVPAVFGVMKDSKLIESLPFSEAYSLNTVSPEVKAAIDKIKASLSGLTVGVGSSTTYSNFLNEYLDGDVDKREYKTSEQMLIDLRAGRIDTVINSMSYWNPLLEKPEGKDIVLVGPKLTGGAFGPGVGVGVRKADEKLLQELDQAVNAATNDGTIKRLSEKWFKMDISVY